MGNINETVEAELKAEIELSKMDILKGKLGQAITDTVRGNEQGVKLLDQLDLEGFLWTDFIAPPKDESKPNDSTATPELYDTVKGRIIDGLYEKDRKLIKMDKDAVKAYKKELLAKAIKAKGSALTETEEKEALAAFSQGRRAAQQKIGAHMGAFKRDLKKRQTVVEEKKALTDEEQGDENDRKMIIFGQTSVDFLAKETHFNMLTNLPSLKKGIIVLFREHGYDLDRQ